MKIVKALKQKNRLAGEVASLQEVLKRENSRRSDNPSKIVVETVTSQLKLKREELIDLKGRISKASAGIASKLARLEETKQEKNYFAGLPTREGTEVAFVGRDQEKLEYVWTAYYNREGVDKKLAELQEEINNLQDEVDTFNASTDV